MNENENYEILMPRKATKKPFYTKIHLLREVETFSGYCRLNKRQFNVVLELIENEL